MTSARICQNCGHSLTANDRFCPQCGTGQIPAPTPVPQATGPWEGILDRLARAVAPRYRVVRLIGYGGMAGVYLAEEPRLGRRVALKVMAPGLMVDGALVTRFQQEARTTAQLNHPNIVTIYDVDHRDDLHFFVMAYVPGRTLGQITKQGTESLPVRAVLHWFAQAGSGLAYAHRMGIVHRDIKPANIMVDGFGNALVTDFGIAKVADEPSLTRTGFLVGTPTYMSPEQCGGLAVSGASDQYSLGIVLYELLTGKPPFSGPTVSVLQAHVGQQPRPVRELRPDCPPALADAIDRMLLKAPEDRFPTVAAAVSAAGAVALPDDDPLRDRLGTMAAVADTVELPPAPALSTGEATALPAKVLDAQGRPLPGRSIRWVSDTPALLSVNEEGVAYALAPGTARVTAWCDGVAATTQLEITPAPGPLTRLADAAVATPPPGATELFDPTPASLTPPPPPPPQTTTPVDVQAPAQPTPPPTPTPIPDRAEAPTPVPEPAFTAPPSPAESVPADEPTADVPAASTAAVLSAEQSRPVAKRRMAPIVAGVGVLVVALLGAVSLLDLGGAPGDDVATQPTGGAPDGGETGDGSGFVPPPAGLDSTDEERLDGPPGPVTTAGVEAEAGGTGSADRPSNTDTPRVTTRTQPPPAPPPGPPAPPVTGALRIAGALPAGAQVTLSAPGQDDVAWREGTALRPGVYTVRVNASGYEPYSSQVTIAAGETATLSPELRAEQVTPPVTPPPAQPPASGAGEDVAAAEAAVRGVIASFAESLESRDLDAIARAYPASSRLWSDGWRLLISDTRNVRNLATDARDVTTEIDGSTGRVVFTLELRFTDIYNAQRQAASRFEATLQRQPAGWTMTGIREVR